MISYHTTYKYILRNQIVQDKFTVLSKKLYVQLKEQHCISYCVVQFWNSLDDKRKCATLYICLKNLLKKYYYLPAKKNEYMFYFSSQLL